LYGYSLGGDDDDDFILEQLWLNYAVNDQLDVIAGKFNSPIGMEKVDPWDWFAILPSLTYGLWHHHLTGILVKYRPTDSLTLQPYIYNGYNLDEDNNNSFTYALTADYRLTEDLRLGSTVSYGPPFPENDADDTWLFDAEVYYTGIPNAFLGMEYIYVMADTDRVKYYSRLGNVSYHGALGAFGYDFTRFFRLTLQGSWVSDDDGFLWGEEQDRWEFSIIPSIFLAEALEIRLQYQHIESDAAMHFDRKDPEQGRYADSDDIFGIAAFWWF
jgi:hypothetical protein